MKLLLRISAAFAVIIAVHAALWSKKAPLVDHSEKPAAREARRKIFEQYFRQAKPEVVLLGNSMLMEGIDPRSFMNYTRKRTMRFARGGTASAWWYLGLKNIIAESENKPEVVVVFFRDTFLTMPDYRVHGKYKLHLNDFCNEEEPVLDRLAYLKGMDRPTYLLNKYSPLFQQKDGIRNNIELYIKQNCAGKVLGTDSESINKATAAVFDRKNMNQQLMTRRQEAAEAASKKSFEDSLNKSFLPHMIDIAEENDIHLVFVRVKRRRDIKPDAQPQYLKEYIADLRGYLQSKDIELIDFTDNRSLKKEHFADGDHLSRSIGRPLFTKMTAEALMPIIREHSQ